MHPKLSATIHHWAASLLIGLVPLLCHLVLSYARPVSIEHSDAWSIGILFVSITTWTELRYALYTVGYRDDFLCVPKAAQYAAVGGQYVGLLVVERLVWCSELKCLNRIGLLSPILFLVIATGASLYFEILIALESTPQAT